MKLLLVSVGSAKFAVAADAVERIVDPALDGGGRYGGAVDAAGEALPILDLHAETGEPAGAHPIYLLLSGPGRRVAVSVDAAETIRDVPADRIAPLPTFIFARDRRLCRGIFADDRGARLVLDERVVL